MTLIMSRNIWSLCLGSNSLHCLSLSFNFCFSKLTNWPKVLLRNLRPQTLSIINIQMHLLMRPWGIMIRVGSISLAFWLGHLKPLHGHVRRNCYHSSRNLIALEALIARLLKVIFYQFYHDNAVSLRPTIFFPRVLLALLLNNRAGQSLKFCK